MAMSFPPISLASGPIPPQRFYHDPILFNRIQQLETEVQRLSGHMKMVELELQNEKRKSNQQNGQASKPWKLNVEVRVLTSAEGMRLAAEKDAEHIAKAQKKKEVERQQKEKEVARDQQRQVCPPDQPFTGSLTSKNKRDLQEIAGALNLSEDGMKNVLILCINSFFDSNPLERETPQSSGLFQHASRRCLLGTENAHSVASTSQFASYNTYPPLVTNIVNLPNISSSHPETMLNTYTNFFATLHTNT